MNKKQVEKFAPWVLLLVVVVSVAVYLQNKVSVDYNSSGASYGGFGLMVPNNATLKIGGQGGSVNIPISATATALPVTFEVSEMFQFSGSYTLPPGITAEFSPTSCSTSPCNSILTLTAKRGTTAGIMRQITISALAGGERRSAIINLTMQGQKR